jgi:hypothetical protein
MSFYPSSDAGILPESLERLIDRIRIAMSLKPTVVKYRARSDRSKIETVKAKLEWSLLSSSARVGLEELSVRCAVYSVRQGQEIKARAAVHYRPKPKRCEALALCTTPGDFAPPILSP